MLCDKYLVRVLVVVNRSPKSGYLTWTKPSKNVMLLKPKHVSTLPSYMAVINGLFPNWLFLNKQQTQTIWILKTSLYCTTWLGQHQTRLNTITLIHFKPATLTSLDIILFDGQLINIHYRNNIHIMLLILQFLFLKVNYFFQPSWWLQWEKLPIGVTIHMKQSLSWWI